MKKKKNKINKVIRQKFSSHVANAFFSCTLLPFRIWLNFDQYLKDIYYITAWCADVIINIDGETVVWHASIMFNKPQTDI